MPDSEAVPLTDLTGVVVTIDRPEARLVDDDVLDDLADDVLVSDASDDRVGSLAVLEASGDEDAVFVVAAETLAREDAVFSPERL